MSRNRRSGNPAYFTIWCAAAIILSMALNAQAQTEKILHTFTGTIDGSMPNSGVIFDSAGNLYGATEAGGDPDSCLGTGCGVIYKLSPNNDGWQETMLLRFLSSATGAIPTGNVLLNTDGNLFGAVYAGGDAYACYVGNIDGCGMIFELSPASPQWQESILRDFNNGIDGGIPNGGLIADASGNLYGTTQNGGTFNGECEYSGCGVLFELSPLSGGAWKETLLHTFTEGVDGGFPNGPLIFDSAGNLYGTAFSGGTGNGCQCGVVFELSHTSNGLWKETVLHTFSGNADGSIPFAGLAFDSAGNLYGTTYRGGDLSGCDGYGCGVAFQLSPVANGHWRETVLHSFTGGTDGSQPRAGLAVDRTGNVYGTTPDGGEPNCGFHQTGCGVAFELSPTSNGIWNEIVLHTFTGGADGSLPASGLTLDASGNLYGTTVSGGNLEGCDTSGCGVVFEIIP
jgi:hypothetical protein